MTPLESSLLRLVGAFMGEARREVEAAARTLREEAKSERAGLDVVETVVDARHVAARFRNVVEVSDQRLARLAARMQRVDVAARAFLESGSAEAHAALALALVECTLPAAESAAIARRRRWREVIIDRPGPADLEPVRCVVCGKAAVGRSCERWWVRSRALNIGDLYACSDECVRELDGQEGG